MHILRTNKKDQKRYFGSHHLIIYNKLCLKLLSIFILFIYIAYFIMHQFYL